MSERETAAVGPQPCRACGYDLGRAAGSHCPECGADRTPWTTRWDISRVEVSLGMMVWGLPLLLAGVLGAALTSGTGGAPGGAAPGVLSTTTFQWCLVPGLLSVIGVAILQSSFLARRWKRTMAVLAAVTVCGLILGANGGADRGWVGVDSTGAVVLVNTTLGMVGAVVALIGGTATSVLAARSLTRLGREHAVHVRSLTAAAAALIVMSLVGVAFCDVREAATATRLPGMSFNSATGIARASQRAAWSYRAEPYARAAAGMGVVGLWTVILMVRAGVNRGSVAARSV